jgi:hypothetical protein
MRSIISHRGSVVVAEMAEIHIVLFIVRPEGAIIVTFKGFCRIVHYMKWVSSIVNSKLHVEEINISRIIIYICFELQSLAKQSIEIGWAKRNEARRSSSDGMRVAAHGARKSAAQSLSGLDRAQRYRHSIANEAEEAKAEKAMDGYHCRSSQNNIVHRLTRHRGSGKVGFIVYSAVSP